MILPILAIAIGLIIFLKFRSILLTITSVFCLIWVINKVETQFKNFDSYQKSGYGQEAQVRRPEFSSDVSALIAQEEQENDRCRDSYPPDDEVACEKRDKTIKELASLGACWGPENVAEAGKGWIPCGNKNIVRKPMPRESFTEKNILNYTESAYNYMNENFRSASSSLYLCARPYGIGTNFTPSEGTIGQIMSSCGSIRDNYIAKCIKNNAPESCTNAAGMIIIYAATSEKSIFLSQ